MANTATKWIEAISVLTELTQQGRLKWQVDAPGLGLIASTLRGTTPQQSAYKAKYLDNWFRLTRRVTGQAAFTTILSSPPYSLDIIDESGAQLYAIPETTGLSDLYQAVQYQLSGWIKSLSHCCVRKVAAFSASALVINR